MANDHHHHNVAANDSSNFLELAANDDVKAFRRSLELRSTLMDEFGEWYERKTGSNRIVLQCRTPLMVAATYGSLDVLRLILSFASVDVNRVSVHDNITALHCAASGGSANAVDAVKILLSAGADPNMLDANGHHPVDVIVASPKLPDVRCYLEDLLAIKIPGGVQAGGPPLSSSFEHGVANSTSSPLSNKSSELQPVVTPIERKEYPVDPSIPDIKNSIYATDDFRMFSFKIRPCSRAYSHDWTECPFVHPGENARRRDPRKFHYSCVPCPEFRKGSCRRRDMCEYAHGVFECWLHPAQYRTRLCKDSTNCSRRVCFFAHTHDELRPLFVSTGSAVPSPRSPISGAMEVAAAMGFMPGSPATVSALMSPFTPPISPSAIGFNHYPVSWPQPNIPPLLLPGFNNLQASKLRSSFNAIEMPMDDLSMTQDLDSQQLSNDLRDSRWNASAKYMRSKTVTPSNLDNLFSAEATSSPRHISDRETVFSPSHSTAVLSQFQQQQSLLSHVNTSILPPQALDAQQLTGHASLLQASLGISSSGKMTLRAVEPISPLSLAVLAAAQRETQQQTLRNLSSRDLCSGLSQMMGSPVSSWVKCAAVNLDWGMTGEELGHLRRSPSLELMANCEEPDLSWVHSLVKESPEKKVMAAAWASTGPSGLGPADGEVSVPNGHQRDQSAVLGAWLEQMQLHQTST